jgi:hypothetical protein
MDMGQTSPTPLGTATNAIAPFMPLNLPTLQSRPGLMGTAPISGGTDATGAAVANLNSTQGAMMGQIMAALQNEATNVNAATQNIIRAHTPGANANDFGGMGGALGGIAKGLGGMMGGGMF